MSYDVQLFRIETRQREEQSCDPDFFEKEDYLVPFSADQIKALTIRLERYKFVEERRSTFGTHFHNDQYGISALLTDRAVYFQSGWDGDAIFELSMTASEFTDSGEFAKYDRQNNGWED